jgi:hypothetical protein
MTKISGTRILFVGVMMAILATVVYGFVVAGSPSRERARRLDTQKVDALNQVSYSIDEWYRVHGKMPSDLGKLNLDPYVAANAARWIEFSPGKNGEFELCATFTEPTGTNDPYVPRPVTYPVMKGDRSFRHEAGRQCFALQVVSVGAPGTPVTGCSLMAERTTGKVGCYGCSGKVCDTAPVGWVPYEPDGPVGVNYACFAGDQGCQLAQ